MPPEVEREFPFALTRSASTIAAEQLFDVRQQLLPGLPAPPSLSDIAPVGASPMLTERGGRRVRAARHRALPAGRRLAYDAGTGLGLALVDTVLAGRGGDLWLCTGSTHHRYLPAHHAQVGCGHGAAGSSGTVLTAVLPLAPAGSACLASTYGSVKVSWPRPGRSGATEIVTA